MTLVAVAANLNQQNLNQQSVQQPVRTIEASSANSENANSAPNYVGGASILVLLAVMLTAGFSAAGLLPRRDRKPRRSVSGRHWA